MVVLTFVHGTNITTTEMLCLEAGPSSSLNQSRSSIKSARIKIEARTSSRRPLVAQIRPLLALPSKRVLGGRNHCTEPKRLQLQRS